MQTCFPCLFDVGLRSGLLPTEHTAPTVSNRKVKKAEQYRSDLLHQREGIDRKLNELDARLTRDRDVRPMQTSELLAGCNPPELHVWPQAFRSAAEQHKRTCFVISTSIRVEDGVMHCRHYNCGCGSDGGIFGQETTSG